MAYSIIPLSVVACFVLLSFAMGGPVDESRDTEQSNLEDRLEERLLARLEGTLRENGLQRQENTEGEEKETVQKVNSDLTKTDITLDNKLIEQRISDCAKEYELIIINDDGTRNKNIPMACYVHKMDQALFESVCKGVGERVPTVYKVSEEVSDKDFLSEDGPDSVCKKRPMYMIVPIKQLTPKDASKNKRACSTYCCSYGWWTGRNSCKGQCLAC